MKTVALSLFVATVVSWLATPWVRALALRVGVVDQPGGRRIHQHPTPRWGGIAIWLGVMAAIAASTAVGAMGGWFHLNAQVVALLGAATLVAAVGLLDDKFELSALWQAAALLAVSVLVAQWMRIDSVTNPFTRQSIPVAAWLGVPLTAMWLFGVTKTIDLVDGLDGLASGVCAIASMALVVMALLMPIPHVTQPVAVVCAAVAGASVGFLRYNYPPARIFMGTVGAQFMGFVIAGAAVIGAFKMAAALAVIVPILALGVPLFDAAFAVARRAASGKPIYMPDRGHLHHRLLDAGLTVNQAILVIYAATFVLSAGALLVVMVLR